jgi:hypothetical protein
MSSKEINLFKKAISTNSEEEATSSFKMLRKLLKKDSAVQDIFLKKLSHDNRTSEDKFKFENHNLKKQMSTLAIKLVQIEAERNFYKRKSQNMNHIDIHNYEKKLEKHFWQNINKNLVITLLLIVIVFLI